MKGFLASLEVPFEAQNLSPKINFADIDRNTFEISVDIK